MRQYANGTMVRIIKNTVKKHTIPHFNKQNPVSINKKLYLYVNLKIRLPGLKD